MSNVQTINLQHILLIAKSALPNIPNRVVDGNLRGVDVDLCFHPAIVGTSEQGGSVHTAMIVVFTVIFPIKMGVDAIIGTKSIEL